MQDTTDKKHDRKAPPVSRIPAFIERLRAIPPDETKRIWGAVMAERKALRTYRYADGDEERAYSLPAIKNTLTAYRNAIRQEFGESHPALDRLKLSDDEAAEFRADNRDQIIDRNNSRRPIDGEELVQTAIEVLKRAATAPTMELAAALLLLTGRRPIEVLKVGEFTPSKKRKHIRFSGQAKRRELVVPDYDFPVIGATPRAILDALATLRQREDTSGLTNQGVNARHSKYLGRAAARLFHTANGEALTPSDLRKAYAAISYWWDGPDEVSMNAYFAKVLGHSPLDLFTSLSYMAFYPAGQKREYMRDYKTALDDALKSQRKALAGEKDDTKRKQIEERVEQLSELADEAAS